MCCGSRQLSCHWPINNARGHSKVPVSGSRRHSVSFPCDWWCRRLPNLYVSSEPTWEQLSIERLWDLTLEVFYSDLLTSWQSLTLFLFRSTRIRMGVPDPPSGSTLLSHWTCCYFPWKVRLFLLHQVSAFVFLSLHKTLCSVRGLAAPASQNNRDFVLLPYLALTPISGRLTDCSNHLFLAQ